MSETQSQPKNNEHINLRVVAPVRGHSHEILTKLQDGGEVYFKIKRSTQLKKLMDAYCDRQSISPNSIRFLYDGQRIRDDQTPDLVRIPNILLSDSSSLRWKITISLTLSCSKLYVETSELADF